MSANAYLANLQILRLHLETQNKAVLHQSTQASHSNDKLEISTTLYHSKSIQNNQQYVCKFVHVYIHNTYLIHHHHNSSTEFVKCFSQYNFEEPTTMNSRVL